MAIGTDRRGPPLVWGPALFRAMVQRSSDAAIIADPDGTIRYASPAIARFGYEPADLFGRNVRDLVHPDDRAARMDVVDRGLAADGTVTVEWRVRDGDGRWRWVEEAISELRETGIARGIVMNLRDTTDRRAAEESLRASEERLRRLFDESPVGTGIVGIDGCFIEVNTALARTLGHEPIEMVGRSISEVVHPFDVADALGHAATLFAGTCDGYQAELRLVRQDGEVLDARLTASLVRDNAGEPLYAIGIVKDETELRRSSKRLAENEERLRMALDAAQMATWEHDMVTDVVTVSGNYEAVHGLPAGTFGHTMSDFLALVHPDDAHLFSEVLASETDTFALEYRFLSPLRGLRTMQGRGRLVRDRGGDVARVVGTALDVTAERAMAERRLEDELVFRRTIEATTDAFIGTDADGCVVDWNASAERIFGWTAAEACGRNVADLIVPAELRHLHQIGFAGAVAAGDAGRFGASPAELTAQRCDGSRLPVEVSVVSVQRNGRLQFNGFVRDITDRKAAEAALLRQALTDELTGLPNRTLLQDRLRQALRRTEGSGWTAVLFIDVDRLMVVNDSLGHAAGDRLLAAIGERVRAASPDDATVARFAGDEFVVLTECRGGVHQVVGLAESIRAAVEEPLVLDERELRPSVCIGVALTDHDLTAPEDLFRDADLAMRRAKQRGRNRVELFDRDMLGRAMSRLSLEVELRRAIDGGQLRLHYQPVMSRDGALASAEALLRWHHPERGLLGPEDLIDLAEDTGLIVPIGAWAVGEACRQLAEWRRTSPALSVAVNLSTRQLLEPGLQTMVRDELLASGLPGDALTLELTESTLVQDATRAGHLLTELRALGVRLAVDDFGTGYSSLLYLRNFPVQVLKLDRYFVAGLTEHAEDAAIIRSTIDLAHTLGLEAIAEGVETAEQFETLRANGCDLMQGYLWSPPVSPDHFAKRFLAR
ncbi:MAG: PAS domain S-box protein [Acidimicrobiia bacterium]|nr:PAS domain S-box protein [Acidimicrobiia bacterium]